MCMATDGSRARAHSRLPRARRARHAWGAGMRARTAPCACCPPLSSSRGMYVASIVRTCGYTISSSPSPSRPGTGDTFSAYSSRPLARRPAESPHTPGSLARSLSLTGCTSTVSHARMFAHGLPHVLCQRPVRGCLLPGACLEGAKATVETAQRRASQRPLPLAPTAVRRREAFQASGRAWLHRT